MPGPPRANVSNIASRSISVRWDPPSDPNGVIRGYRVRWRNIRRDGGISQYRYPSSDERQITLENLHPHTQYIINISANTSAGWGQFRNFTTITMEDCEWQFSWEIREVSQNLSFFINSAPTGPPVLNESIQQAGVRQLHLQWNPPEPQQQNGVITSYTICIGEREDGMEDCELYSTSSTNMTVTGLLPYTVYRYKIAADTSVGRGPYTGEFSIQTLEDGECCCSNHSYQGFNAQD